MAQVMQQPFGPIFRGVNAGSEAVSGGDHGDQFVGLMGDDDDSLPRVEGFEKNITDSPLASALPIDPALPSNAAIAAQFNVQLQTDFKAAALSSETYAPLGILTATGDQSHTHLSAGFVVPDTAQLSAASVGFERSVSSYMPAGDAARAHALTGGGVVIPPALAATALAENMPIFDETAQNLAAADMLNRMKANQAAADIQQTAGNDSGAPSPATAASPAANFGGQLDMAQGSSASSRADFASTSLMHSAMAGAQTLTAQALFGQPASVDGGVEVPAADASADRLGDNGSAVPMLLRSPAAPASSAAFVAIQAMMQNAEAQTTLNGTTLAKGVQAEAGDLPNPPILPPTPAAPAASVALSAGQIHAQIQAQITAANFAALVDGAQDDLGLATNDDAGLDGVSVEARAGFTSSHLPGALGTASSGFSGAPASAAHLSAQLLPFVKSAQAGPVELVLSPVELGQLRFEIQHRGDQVQIVLSAERPETLDLLRRNSDQLLADFRNAGFAGASLAFGGWGAGQNSDAHPQDRDHEVRIDARAGAIDTQSSLPNQNAAFARPQSYLDPSRSLNLRL